MDKRFGKQMTAEERAAWYDRHSKAVNSLNGQLRQMFGGQWVVDKANS
jgi:hypothetical protein